MRMNAKTAVLLVVLTLPLSGCLFRTRKADTHVPASGVLREATTEQLIAAINSEAAVIRSLKASVEITASVTSVAKNKITDYRDISGYLLVRKPGDLRLFGLVPVVGTRLFDLASDGQRFKLSIPVQNKFITGSSNVTRPSAQPLENLRPQEIFDALLIRAVDPQTEIAVLENGVQTISDPKSKQLVDEPIYILSIVRKRPSGWYLARKLTIGRRDLRPQQQLVYDNDGSVVTDVLYHEFKETDGILFPTEISIRRPKEGNTIRLTLTKLDINPEFRSDQFALDQPAGARLIDLDAASSTSESLQAGSKPVMPKQKSVKPVSNSQRKTPPKKVIVANTEPPALLPSTEIKTSGVAETELAHDSSLTTEQLLANAEAAVAGINRQLTPEQQYTLSQINLFVKASRSALDQGSTDKAHALAVKAWLLSRSLVDSR